MKKAHNFQALHVHCAFLWFEVLCLSMGKCAPWLDAYHHCGLPWIWTISSSNFRQEGTRWAQGNHVLPSRKVRSRSGYWYMCHYYHQNRTCPESVPAFEHSAWLPEGGQIAYTPCPAHSSPLHRYCDSELQLFPPKTCCHTYINTHFITHAYTHPCDVILIWSLYLPGVEPGTSNA